jgi:hypothetical protein
MPMPSHMTGHNKKKIASKKRNAGEDSRETQRMRKFVNWEMIEAVTRRNVISRHFAEVIRDFVQNNVQM